MLWILIAFIDYVSHVSSRPPPKASAHVRGREGESNPLLGSVSYLDIVSQTIPASSIPLPPSSLGVQSSVQQDIYHSLNQTLLNKRESVSPLSYSAIYGREEFLPIRPFGTLSEYILLYHTRTTLSTIFSNLFSAFSYEDSNTSLLEKNRFFFTSISYR